MFLLWLILILLVLGILGMAFRYPVQRIWVFWRRRYRLRTRGDPFRRFRRERYNASLGELRDFASSLLLGTSMKATLAQALQKTAEQFKNRGIFGERLNRYVEARVAESPESVIEGLIQDFRSEHLSDMLRRIEISRQTGGALVDALALTVDAIEEDISSGVSREIREAANQLTVPMILGVFLSIVALGILPLVIALFDRLGG
jgi:ABC-type multidrug transport system fused ATPase/permease subunit